MAIMAFKGLDEWTSALEKLTDDDSYLNKALYDGAGIVADLIKSAINSLPTDDRTKVSSGEKRTSIRSMQKAALSATLGISKHERVNGNVKCHIGFSGYNNIKTKRWPNGQPNAMVARALNSGTSYMQKNAFVDKSSKMAEKKACDVMSETLQNEVEKLIGEWKR